MTMPLIKTEPSVEIPQATATVLRLSTPKPSFLTTKVLPALGAVATRVVLRTPSSVRARSASETPRLGSSAIPCRIRYTTTLIRSSKPQNGRPGHRGGGGSGGGLGDGGFEPVE